MSKYYDFVEITNYVNNLPHGNHILDYTIKGIKKFGMDKAKVYNYAGPWPQSWNIEFNNIWSMLLALNKSVYKRLTGKPKPE